MRFLEFKKHFEPFIVFSTQDVLKWDPNFDSRRLVEWQGKNYLKRVINRWYTFSEAKDLSSLFLLANRIYSPSYISFESALAYYRLIPEGVYTITSATSLKTNMFTTALGAFSYRHIKKNLLFGYKLVSAGRQQCKMAEPEKLILDYLYLNPRFRKAEDFDALRLNYLELSSLVDPNRMNEYLALFKSKELEKRTDSFIKTMLNNVERK